MRRTTLTILAALLATRALGQVPEDCRSDVANPPAGGGPRDHIVVQATSSDASTFATAGAPDLLKASVPDAVERPDGETWVYFISGEAGYHGIHIGQLGDDGTISPFECVRLDGNFDGHAVDPDIVALPDGRFRLFYKKDFALEVAGEPSIASAISSDGIHFDREAIAYDGAGGYDPTVVRLPNGSWLMAIPNRDTITLAASTDGQHFVATGVVVNVRGIPELWHDGATLHLLAGGERLYHQVSSDNGATWTELESVTVAGLGDTNLGSPSIAGHDGAWRLFLVRSNNFGGGGGQPGACQPSPTTLCLGQGRFRVTATWRDPAGHQGAGHPQGLGRDSGLFWFYRPDNVELLVKVINGCSVNGSYWIYAAGLTNLEVEVRVEDLVGHAVWSRRSQQGRLFPPFADTAAFATCDAGT